MNWENKKILITGGSSGIGKQLVKDFSVKGAEIVFCGLEQELISEVENSTTATGFLVDLTKENELLSFFSKAIKILGNIDILINNAGFVIAEPFESLKRADFEKMFALNTIAPAQLSQLVIPYFKKNGFGDIVNIGATGGYYAFNKGTAYSCSKAALNIISKNLSLEFRKDNIRVFHVDPSWCTDTNNNAYGTAIPKDENLLNPVDISTSIIHSLEMNRRAFIPQMSIWATNP
ncbi:SDR family oxidoreductase [Aureivirga marina]|uniref:SDR family oxidoreductase n=1 Tax=Aureivirga marina TaxID=1182451 RepID=UPI0018CBD738|nr:SDR family NAD(P)-dependent oxidoreductase [Aureivirga marina]